MTKLSDFGTMEWYILLVIAAAVSFMIRGLATNDAGLIAQASPFAALALAMAGGATGRWVGLSTYALVISVVIPWIDTRTPFATGFYPNWAIHYSAFATFSSLAFDALGVKYALRDITSESGEERVPTDKNWFRKLLSRLETSLDRATGSTFMKRATSVAKAIGDFLFHPFTVTTIYIVTFIGIVTLAISSDWSPLNSQAN
ncbi:hypothetical protein [Clavibacter capsici]|nr:hypothetical protein [Clavibacter capsici]QIS40503.1 hypothetical protein GW572_15040 [Clavibacter capsici]